MSPAPRIVLASTSPRRAELVRSLGLDAIVRPTAVDERVSPGEDPRAHVERLARAKAEAGASAEPDAVVIAGDTVVVMGGRILGKPGDEEEAVQMILGLGGVTHEVFSGVAVVAGGRTHSGVSSARVRFKPVSDTEARAYVATGEPLDKAGAYGIQGAGAALVEELSGDYYAVVGLPIRRMLDLLESAGWRYRFGRLEPTEVASG